MATVKVNFQDIPPNLDFYIKQMLLIHVNISIRIAICALFTTVSTNVKKQPPKSSLRLNLQLLSPFLSEIFT